MVETMKLDELLGYTAHAEYLCKPLANMSRADVPHQGDFAGSMDDLIGDIRANGIRVPLHLQEDESGERWLRNGHHRLVAAMELGLQEVPVAIHKK
tara:strand:- start:1200 stop:1487 length:288 start_codon:yes stop_codon:yes gene_type:complete